ncbi:MAG: Transcriptional regulator, AraC family protein [Myxococcaceae bacterium]|nr:Transcriptional regulator, AraC family protein [Myxococcaceae bacterium]
MGDTSGQPRAGRGSAGVLVPAEYAAHLADVVTRFHVRVETLLKGTGLTPSLLDKPAAMVARESFFKVCERAIALTEEPGLGFYYGLSLKLSSHGAPGLLAMTSGTLGDAVATAERYVRLRAMQLRLHTSLQDGCLVIAFSDDVPESLRVFHTEAFFVTLVHMGRALVGHPITGACEMAFAEPAHFRRFAHLLPGEVRFSCAENRLIVPAHLLAQAVVTSDAVMARRIERDCQRELAALDERASFLSTIRRQLRPEAGDFPGLEELAERTQSSTRTIKRKLAEQGTTYRKLVDTLRRERAVELLREGDHSVEKVARMLGYTDAASLHRSWRRWFGGTPGGAP